MAVDSFLAFKRLMVKRNEELNRQAVEMYSKMEKAQAEKATPTATGAENASATQAAAGSQAAKPDATPETLLSDEDKKKQAAELKEVMRLAHTLERQEEEEMMRKALEESEKLKSEEQKAIDEEEEMIR